MIKRLLNKNIAIAILLIILSFNSNNIWGINNDNYNEIKETININRYLLIVFNSLLIFTIALLAFLLLKNKSKRYRFKQLSSATFEGIIIHSHGKIIDVNRSFEKMSGYRYDELLKMSIFDFIDKDIYTQNTQKKESFFETQIHTVTNEIVLVEVLEKPYAISRKSVKVLALRDISNLNKMLEQNRLLSAAVEQSANTVLITDKTGKIIYVNPRFTKLTGYTFEEVLGKNPRILKSGEQSQEFYENFWATISSGKEWVGEFRNKKKNGELFWEEAFIAPVKNIKNEVEYYIAIKENITRRKLTEQALRDSESKLRELNATKDKFFSIIAHDLKSPIGNIKSFLDIIIDNQLKTDQETYELYIKMLRENAAATYSLLENLLSWARSQRGEIPFIPQNIEFKPLVNETISLLALVANKKQICIVNDVPENIMVFADMNMIITVIRNLIANAIKFSNPNSTISIISYRESDFIKTAITDQGIGIKPDDIHSILNSNQYLSTYGTENEKGHGLGLPLCREFVEKHGGKLSLTSEYGKGSTFYFTIPIAKAI
jgi:PAS domain S-box-containing protein